MNVEKINKFINRTILVFGVLIILGIVYIMVANILAYLGIDVTLSQFLN